MQVKQPVAATVKKKSLAPEKIFRIQIFIILGLSIMLYANTMLNKFTLDDTLIITQNKFTKMGLKGIGKIMTNDAFVGFFGENKNLLPGGRYRPLSQVIFSIEYQFTGLNPFLGHLINMLTYAGLCVIVLLLLNKLLSKTSISNSKLTILNIPLTLPFLAALLFAAHPLHTEAVANIKGLDEVLCMLLSVCTLLFSVNYIDTKKIFYLPLILVFFLLAILTKENAITFIAIIPLTLYFFRKVSVKEQAFVLLPIFLGTIVYFFIRYKALGFIFGHMATEKELLNNPFLVSSVSDKYATIMLTWGKYLLLLLFPYNLTHDYYPKQIPIIGWGDLRAIIPLLIFAGITIYALRTFFIKKNQPLSSNSKIISYAILFYLITFSIGSNLIFNIGAFMNERFIFVSLLGFSLILALYLIKLSQKNLKLVDGILLVVLLFYSAKTISRNMTWKDDYTLFTTDVNTSSNSAKCNVSAGGMYYEKAKTEKDSIKKNEMLNTALGYLNKGVELHPQYHAGWMLLGNVYLEMKDYGQSKMCYESLLKFSPTHPDALNNLLFVAQQTDKKDQIKLSIESFRLLNKYKPDNPDYLYQYASVLAKSGKTDTALVILNKLITDNAKNFNAYNKLGEIYGRYIHDMNRSLSYLFKAYSIKSDDASILENLGVAHGIIGKYPESVEYFKKALKAKPDNAQVLRNLAGTYRNMGNTELANKALTDAKEMDKKKPEMPK